MKPGSIVAAGLAVIAGILGFWGFNSVDGGCEADRIADCFAHYANTLWKTLALFVFEADITEANENNLCLVVARILAPAATGIALYNLVSTHIALLWTLFRLRRMRGHTIVIGDGQVGRSFVDGCKAGEAVAVIDLTGATKKVDVTRSGTNRTVRFLRGDARDRAVLQSAAAGHAARVFIVAGDDTANL
ncbi:MAG: NAD-binding protein, partial [Pseudomonadota bacterium]